MVLFILTSSACGSSPTASQCACGWRRWASVITAGDIEAPADVEIVNPELQLLTLDTLESELEFEMTVERGVGYSPAEERPTGTIGEIPVDAIYSPIVKVRTNVEAARIEQITDYDLLKLEIWTDGTMRPAEALSKAANILLQHLSPPPSTRAPRSSRRRASRRRGSSGRATPPPSRTWISA